MSSSSTSPFHPASHLFQPNLHLTPHHRGPPTLGQTPSATIPFFPLATFKLTASSHHTHRARSLERPNN